ncbi:MAG TPA: tetratricopeptide repeat protein, partial [Verrucomicrobiae bacterium]|nr:tetratricopeptide repeat protein [Verrucomicrobiae bacterium]
LSLVGGVVTIWFQQYRALEGHAVRPEGFAARLATAGWVPWFYLHKALMPLHLMLIYPNWQLHALLSYLPGTILLGAFALSWWKRNSWGRPVLFALGYFVVTLLPVLGFVDQGLFAYSFVADHWQYYSIIGIIALIVAAGTKLCHRWGERGRETGVLISVVVLGLLGTATWKRASVYRNDETLWRDSVKKNPNAWVAHNNLGTVLRSKGNVSEAITEIEEALRIKPNDPGVLLNLGVTLERAGQEEDAVKCYEQALRLRPDYGRAHTSLGNALMRLGRMPEALDHFEQALRIEPGSAIAYYNMGVALVRLDRTTEAIGYFRRALRLQPDYAEAHNNLGVALRRTGRIPEAIREYERALEIKPDYANAHVNLGNALLQSGDVRGALGHYEQALRIKPDLAEAHYHLGVALEQAGRIQEAITHYEQALQLKPDYAEARNNLARLRAVISR